MSCWNLNGPAQCLLGGMIVTLPKKCDLSKCNNWWVITLISVPGKVFSIVLLNHQLTDFWSRQLSIEEIFVMRQVVEQSLEYQQWISLNFIDFVKAFDSVHRKMLCKISWAYGILICWHLSQPVTRLSLLRTDGRRGNRFFSQLKLLNNKVACFHRWYSTLSSTSSASIPSTTCTSAYPGQVATSSLQISTLQMIIVFGPTQTALWNLTTALENQVASTGFQISGQKTNHPIWNSPSLSLQIKLRLLGTIVMPTMTYTCESWKMTEAITQKFAIFHLRCLSHVFKITYQDYVMNMEIYTAPLRDHCR